MLSQLTPDRFEQVMASKVTGAWNLHRLTLGVPLDFFVCFSSISAVLGSAGQSNYGSANAGLDAFAHYRRRLGLPALTINWGPWADVGMAVGHTDRLETWYQQIAPAQGVRILEQLIQQDRTQLSVVGLDVKRKTESMSGTKTLFLSELLTVSAPVASAPSAQPVERQDEKKSIRALISAADAPTKRRLLQDYLTEQISKILQVSPSELNVNRALSSVGIDSLMALEMRNRIESDLPVRVQISSLLEGLTADDLARNLLNQMQSEPQAKPAERIARVKQEVDQMSDEAVRALLEAKRQEANRRKSSQ
jgi:KR domain-containing protein/phosphopantetheine binding protein